MKLFNHVVECHFRARRKWNDFKVFKEDYYTHVVWGRMSLIFGQPHLTPVRVCAHCYEEIQVLNSGDEWWDYCEGCHQVEGDTVEITMEEYEARQ
jgi:hypothetical protein